MYRSMCIIGAGVIGGAVARILARKRFVDRLIATRRNLDKIRYLEKYGVVITDDNVWAVENSDVVFLSVKPTNVGEVLSGLGGVLGDKLLISVVAGVPISYLRRYAPDARVVRAMPNLCLLVGESFTVYCFSDNVSEADRDFVSSLFQALGMAYEVDEGMLNAYTGYTGSGPAYIAIFIEALFYAGLKVGIPRDISLAAAAQLAIGTGRLIRDGKMHYSEVKERVVTPAGTTIEGIFELESTDMRRGLMKAVEKATRRGDELSRLFK